MMNRIREQIACFEEEGKLDQEEYEEFAVEYGQAFEIDLLKVLRPLALFLCSTDAAPSNQDHIILEASATTENDILAKCAVSHALALSVKLSVFEEVLKTLSLPCPQLDRASQAVARTIDSTKELPEDLSVDGRRESDEATC